MGITGLLPFIKKASRPIHVNELSGSTVAVDAYCWLHKGGFACAEALALNKPTDRYVVYVMKYVRLLLGYNVKVILVFDGANLPSKQDTEKKRRENRESYRKKAAAFLAEGKKSEARECFERSVNVTHQMANNVMKAARGFGVDCIVAPYEADAQLAFLNLSGIADFIITEDSDLLLFGCKQVIFKLDPAGNGVLVERNRLSEACSIKPDLFSMDKFRFVGILAGCDYFPGIPGIGLAGACKVMQKTRLDDLAAILSKLHMYTSKQLAATITLSVIDAAMKAFNTFLYQLVFDPISRLCRPLTDYPPGKTVADFPYAGEYVSSPGLAYQLALGNRDPNTHEVVDNFDPDKYKPHSLVKIFPDSSNKNSSAPYNPPSHLLSIWSVHYQPAPSDSPLKKIATTLKECNRYIEQGKRRWQKIGASSSPTDPDAEETPTEFSSTTGQTMRINYHLPSREIASQMKGTPDLSESNSHETSLGESMKDSSISSQYSVGRDSLIPSSTSFDMSFNILLENQSDKDEEEEDVGDILEMACASKDEKTPDDLKSPVFSRKRFSKHVPLFEKSPTFQPVEKKAKFHLDSYRRSISPGKSSPNSVQLSESRNSKSSISKIPPSNGSKLNSIDSFCINRDEANRLPEDNGDALSVQKSTKPIASTAESLKKSFDSSFSRFWKMARPSVNDTAPGDVIESGNHVVSSHYFSRSQTVSANSCHHSGKLSSSQPDQMSKSSFSFRKTNRLSAAYKCSLEESSASPNYPQSCSLSLNSVEDSSTDGLLVTSSTTNTPITKSTLSVMSSRTENYSSQITAHSKLKLKSSLTVEHTKSNLQKSQKQSSLDSYLSKWQFKRKDQLQFFTNSVEENDS